MMFLGNDLDEDGPAELAQVADVVDGLEPEFVHTDGLRHHDLDGVVVVLLDPLGADDLAARRDHSDKRVEMVGADQAWARAAGFSCD